MEHYEIECNSESIEKIEEDFLNDEPFDYEVIIFSFNRVAGPMLLTSLLMFVRDNLPHISVAVVVDDKRQYRKQVYHTTKGEKVSIKTVDDLVDALESYGLDLIGSWSIYAHNDYGNIYKFETDNN